MRYRIYGQDLISKEPRPPLDIEAETEEAARTQAAEMGMDILQVEPMRPVPAEPLPSQSVALNRLAGNRPQLGAVQPWSRTRWMLVGLVLVLLALAGGIGIGIVLPRVSIIGPGTPSDPGTTPSAGIRLEEQKSAEELFDLAGQKALILKYSGGDVEFWVEIESQGKRHKIGEFLLWGDDKQPGPDQAVEGYLLWIRNEPDDAGREWWKVAHRRDLVTAQKSGVQLSSPLAQASVTQSKEDRQSSSGSSSQTVQVWTGKAPNGAMTLSTASSSIPSPLPTDREVCLKEIREQRKQSQSTLAATTASALGLLSSPLEGPLLITSALVPGGMDETLDVHTIKVMCKAASRKAK